MYAPKNCVAIWVETEQQVFVETIGRWCQVENVSLVAWRAKAGLNDVDAVSGATRADHGGPLEITWDLKDKLGNLIVDGTYRLRMETADGNSTTTVQNNQGIFTFTKGLVPQIQTQVQSGGHTATIHFDPTALECNNNVVDPGETCDPPSSCPTACEPSGDVCAPNLPSGSAAACNVACAIVPITNCINDDGCCVEGCGPIADNDCADQDIEGGCTTNNSNSAPLAFGALGALLVLGRRRRR